MSKPPDPDWQRFLGRYLGSSGVRRSARGAAAPAGDDAPWSVRELEPGRFAVVATHAPESALPDAVFTERRTAYLAAAVLTAIGADLGAEGRLDGNPTRTASAAEAALTYEAGADAGLTQRLLEALAHSPAALELLLESMDENAVAQARAHLLARRMGGSDTLH